MKNIKKHFSKKISGNRASGAFMISVFSLALSLFGNIQLTHATDLIQNTATDFNAGTYQGSEYNQGVVMKPFTDYTTSTETKLLLRMDGTAGSTTFTDSSSSAKSVTTNGDTKLSTTQSKFGGTSGYFDGSGDYLSIPYSADWSTANGDFTVDTWVYFPTTVTGVFWQSYTDTNNRHGMGITGSSQLVYYANSGGSNYMNIIDPVSMTTNTWYHVAIVRNGSLYTLYKNGVAVGRGTYAGSTPAYSGTFSVGLDQGGTAYFNGYMDNLRVTKGRALWTSNFTPPATATQSVFLSSILNSGVASQVWSTINWIAQGIRTGNGETPASTTGLVAQWNFNETSGTTAASGGTCGASCNGTLTNMTTTGQDAAAASGWTANNKKFGAGALMFDGTDDYVNVPNNASLNGTAGTYGLWVRIPTASTGNGYEIIGKHDVTGSQNGVYVVEYHGNVGAGVKNGSGNVCDASGGWIADNRWHHITFTFSSGGTCAFYKDGVLMQSAANGAFTMSSQPLRIGRSVDSYWQAMPGSVDAVRIYSRVLSAAEVASEFQSNNIEFQTRTGNTATPDATWDSWKPVTGEAQMDSFDNPYLYPTTTSGLVGYWPMDESANGTCTGGKDACDAKSTNHATRTGTTIMDGKSGKARYFNGSSDYLSAPDSADWTFGSGEFTIDTWFRSSNVAIQSIVGQGANSGVNSAFWIGTGAAGKIRSAFATTGSTWGYVVDGNTVICDGNWHHIVMARSGNTVSYYVDGKLDVTLAVSGSIYDSSRTLAIAASNEAPMNYLNGYLDEMRIFKGVARSAAAIQQDYLEGVQNLGITSVKSSTSSSIKQEGTNALKLSTGAPQIDANTVGLWHFEETGGSGAYIKDATANGNHLSINSGAPAVVDGVSGKGRYFNAAASDMMHIAPTASLQPANVTVDAWVKPAAGSGSTFVQYGKESGQSYGLELDSATGKFLCRSYRNAWYTVLDTVAAPTDTWSHVACIYNGSTLSLYVNGTYRNQVADTAGLDYTNVNGLNICAYWGAMYYINCMASVDEVRVSNIARDASWIAEQYRLGRDTYYNRNIPSTDLTSKTKIPFYIAADRPGTYLETTVGESAFANGQCDAGTVGLWRMEEATGTGAYLKDSCRTNHATPTGTTQTDGKVGKARSFNGTNNSASANVNLSSTNVITVDFWMNWASFSNNNMIAIELSTNYNNVNTGFAIAPNNSDTSSFSIGVHETAGWNTTEITRPGPGWHHYAFIFNKGASASQVIIPYVDGVAMSYTKSNSTAMSGTFGNLPLYFMSRAGTTNFAAGAIDEIRISGIARSAADIRAAYEMGLRTHPVTIDFAAKLDSGNLITGSGDTGFTVDGTGYGLIQKATGLYADDRIIIRENYNGTEYAAQGTVSTVNASTGAVTVLAWDAGGTFPAGGFTANATVMKWQRDYWDISNIITGTGSGDAQNQKNAVTNLTLRMTDGTAGRTIYFDDLKNSGGYLTDGTALNNITSSAGQYLQYRSILNSNSSAISPFLSSVTLSNNAGTTPTISSVSPSTGSTGGGSTVTITGTNFSTIASGTGGTITSSGGYTIHTFTSSGTFTVPTSREVEVLVVAGGGGGYANLSGGGGGGGVLTGTQTASGSMNVTVGQGGTGAAPTSLSTNGGNSIFGNFTAIGGGHGGARDTANHVAVTGGSGGGGGSYAASGTSTAGAIGTAGQGNAGGNGYNGGTSSSGGGGGGAGQAGGNGSNGTGGNGGNGISSSISGTATYYAGGGAGGSYGTQGTGGLGGGGNSTTLAGTANTGGGGSGGGNGGSGIVIIRYLSGATVTFDGTPATNVQPLNSTTIIATTPAHSTGAVNVVVTNLDTQTGTLTNGFTYNNPVSVTSVTSNNADGTYAIEQDIDIRVTFNQAVTVTAPNPTLLLETGTTDRQATYVSGSGSTVLIFSYVVQTEDVSSDLEYQSTGALTTTGSIKDGSGSNVLLTLPTLATTNSLGGSKAIAIDTTPTVTSVSPAGGLFTGGNTVTITGTNFKNRTELSADDNTFALWHMNELSGTSVADSSINANTGTATGTTIVDGKSGKARSFNSSSDYITTRSTNLLSNNFTISAWFTVNGTHEIDTEGSNYAGISGQRYLFIPVQYGASAGAGVSVGTNGISVYELADYYMPPLAVYSGTIPEGWNHMAIVYNNRTPSIYLNGILVRTGLTSSKATVYAPYQIGGSDFNGKVDEMKIFNIALNSTQVANLFNSSPTVSFGGTSATNILRVNSTTITATTPAHTAGAVNVVVTNPDSQNATLTNGFTYNTPVSVTSVTSNTNDGSYILGQTIDVRVTFNEAVTVTAPNPTLLLETGSTDRQATYVSGSGSTVLVFSYTVQAGDTSSDLEYQSTSALTTTGSIKDGGGNDFPLTLPTLATANSLGGSKAIVIDTAAPGAPSVLSLNTPTTSPNTVTTPIIAVAGVVSGDTVKIFGDSGCSTQKGSAVASGTTVNITSSALTAGSYTFYANSTDTAGNVSACSTANVSYVLDTAAPAVTSSTPDWSTAAGNSIAISGTGFYSVSAVTVGGESCTGVTVSSPTLLTCTAPANSTNPPANNVDIVVTTPNGPGTGTGIFTYYSAPTVSTISPDNGSTAGNTTVTITGTNFRNGATVSFGGIAATNVNVTSGTTLTAVTPAKSFGLTNITITNPSPDNQSATLTNGYTYRTAPTISSVTAAEGTSAGGTIITVTGTNFETWDIGTGGTVTTSGNYTVHTFSSNGTFTVPTARNVEVLVVAGGGGGGSYGGGGGAGGVIYNSSYSTSGSIAVTVGGGGAGDTTFSGTGTNGSNSVFGTITSNGGGGGASRAQGNDIGVRGANGGSGGGGSPSFSGYGNGGTGIAGQGNNGGTAWGYPAAGGGGAGAVGGNHSGENAGSGGIGLAFNISGSSAYYGGGGGGCTSYGLAGNGGNGGGGKGGDGAGIASGTSGTDNTGGGGGGGAWGYPGGNGGSGIVIVRYLTEGVSISFGGTTATNAQWINSTTLTATTPAHSSGPVDVVVTNPDNDTATLTGGFRYRPIITGVTSNLTNGAYKADQVVDVRVTFNSAVNVTEPAPTLLMETDRLATLTSGSGTTTLVFSYTVQPGDTSSDLEYQSTSALTTTGTIKDATDGDAILTLPALNSANSLAGSKAIVIDTTPPNAPSGLSLNSPASSPSNIATPIITVSGVVSGNTVKLFSDSSCSTQKGSGTAAASSINITSSTLTSGSYTFYANSTDPVGNTSACSSTGVAYILYSDGPTIISITPSWATTAGGSIAIEGTGFYSVSSVTVGGSACTGLNVSSSTSLTCTAPSKTTNPPVNAASVVITTPAGTGTGTFTYYTAPTFSSITPNAGALEGGKSIVIVGNNFRLGATVTVDGYPATLVGYVSSTTLTATTPAGVTSASANVVVTNPAPDNQTATLTNGYTYFDVPTIDTVEPDWKTEAGGNIAITGTNFYSVSAVTVGGTVCTSRALVNQSTITCIAPAKSVGIYPISITTPSGTATSGNILRYHAAPEVFSVSPNVGTTLGGDSITISGSDFRTGATVKLVSGSGPSCTNPQTYNCNGNGLCTTIKCTTPLHATPEAVNIIVTNPTPDFQTATLSSAFNYHGPVISSLNPSSGSTAGGTDVTINGSYFATTSGTPVVQSVRFNSTNATSFEVINASTIHAVAPSHTGAGTVNVTVTNTDSRTSTLTGGFGYTLLTVSTLGNGSVDYYLAANTQARLTFNFSLDAASRQAVQNTLMIGASDYLNFTWSDNNTILDFSSSNAITFDFDVVVILHDPVSGQPVNFLLIDSAIKANQILAGKNTTLNNTQNEAVMITSQEINLNVPNGVTGASINVSPLFSGVSGDLPAIIATSASVVNNPEGGQACDATFDIAAETTVTGDSGWDKTIGAPIAKPLDSVTVEPESEDSTTIVRSVTEVGSPTKRLGFSKGVRVLIKCQAGRLAAFEINNTVTKIMDTCSQDSRVAGNALPTNGACQIDIGDDKVIWTRHFSDFITYDEYSNPTVTGTSPAQGSTSGGTTVTVTGTNFGTGASVKFGETSATGVDVISGTSLTAIAPAHDVGTVDMIVQNPSGNAGTQQNAYTYFDTLTVTTKGNGTVDYTLAADTPSRLTFNFSLDSTARASVESAINAGANKSMTFSWSGVNQILDFSFSTESTFDNDVFATVTGEDITADLKLIDSALEVRQITASALTSITENQTQAVIDGSDEIVMNIPIEVTDSSLNIDPITTGTSGTLPRITVNANTSVGTVNFIIPSGTVVTGASGWNSVITMPSVKANNTVTVTADEGKFATVSQVISIGAGNTSLTFDKGIRIVFAGKAGSYVGWSRNNTFTQITTICSDDSQTAGNSLPSGGDCKITSGSDLIVWTKHFTDYVVYDQNYPPDVTGVSPSSGTIAGGTHVTVSGTNFGTGLTLTFGGAPAQNIDVLNNTQIAADTPAHSAGTVGITVMNTNNGTDTLNNAFIYFNPAPPSEPGETQSGGQEYTQEIICPQNPFFLMSKVPASVTWTDKTVSNLNQESYDKLLANDASPIAANLLTVTDTRSGGNDECPATQRGFAVTAQLSGPLTNGAKTIEASNIRIITTNEGLTAALGEEADYSLPSGTGNLHNVTAPVLYDDYAKDPATIYAKFTMPDPYTFIATSGGTAANPSGTPGSGTDLNNALNGIVTLLTTHTGHNMDISTNTAIKLIIPGNTDPGVYTGTITYTLFAQD